MDFAIRKTVEETMKIADHIIFMNQLRNIGMAALIGLCSAIGIIVIIRIIRNLDSGRTVIDLDDSNYYYTRVVDDSDEEAA